MLRLLATALLIVSCSVHALTNSEIEALKAQYDPSASQLAGNESAVKGSGEDVRVIMAPASTQSAPKDRETALPYFGYNLFKGQNDFSSLQDVPVPQDYVLNVDDQIKVTIYGKTTQKYLLFVGRDGQVELPNVGSISALGTKFQDFVEEASKQVREKITGADVNISLGKVGSMRVFVLGEAANPGGYQVSSLATITQALQTAGGVNQTGSLRKIQVKRDGKVVARIDLYDLLLNGNNSDDIRLQNGDTVFIPPVGSRVGIDGGVLRPAIYETLGPASFSEVLNLAGGYQTGAMRQQITLTSQNSKGVKETFVYQHVSDRLRIRDGDIVFVPHSASVAGIERSSVRVSGSLVTPFNHPWNSNLRVLDVLNVAQIPLNQQQQLLVVLKSRSGSQQKRDQIVDIQAAMAQPNGDKNLALLPNDELVVHSLDKNYAMNNVINQLDNISDGLPYVTLTGAVKRAGKYAWDTKLTLQSLLETAGGFSNDYKQTAYPLFVTVINRDALTGVQQMQAYDLRHLAETQQAVELSNNDIVVVLSRQEVDYLNSVDVRNALRGIVPHKLAAQEKLNAIVSDKIAEEDTPEQVIDTDTNIATTKGAAPLGRSCEGVELLAHISTQGIGRSFGHLRSMAQVTEQQLNSVYQKSMNCPTVFNQYPELLPYLLENTVVVHGEVRKPAIVPVTEQTRFKHVADYLGGFAKSANLENVERTRYSAEGDSLRHHVDLTQQGFLDEYLQTGDVYVVRPRDIDLERGTVQLAGEVKYPGNYVIKKGETLSHLIARAGGLTDIAYPYGAVFTRESVRRQQVEHHHKTMIEMQESVFAAQSMRRDQTSQFLGVDGLVKSLIASMKQAEPIGRMVIEADPYVLAAQPELDIALEPGDRLVIPKRSQHVTVSGQVMNMSSVLQHTDYTAQDYIAKAGGVSRLADESLAFLILPNGEAQPIRLSSWSLSNSSIPPGSTIFVPRDPLPFNAMGFSLDITKIFGNLAVAAASLAVINRK